MPPHDPDAQPVLLITGASSGVGAKTAELAAQAGYRVALLARSTERLAEVTERCGGPERALPIVCDVREWEQQESAVARTLAEFGRLDAAFANAGYPGSGGLFDATPEEWRDTVLTNLYGPALTARACLPALEASEGHLLFTSSMMAQVHSPSMYGATKWGISALGHGLRPELAAKRVKLTLIEPGVIDSDFGRAIDKELEEAMEELEIERALGPEDVANAVIFALTQPSHVAVNTLMLRPTTQVV